MVVNEQEILLAKCTLYDFAITANLEFPHKKLIKVFFDKLIKEIYASCKLQETLNEVELEYFSLHEV